MFTSSVPGRIRARAAPSIMCSVAGFSGAASTTQSAVASNAARPVEPGTAGS